MAWIFRFSTSGEEQLLGLDETVARRIVKKLRTFCDSGKPLSFAKPLRGAFSDVYRFRIGDYRVLFTVAKDGGEIQIVLVIKVGHRRDVYDE